MAKDRHLIIANAYPDESNIYNYMFLHRRKELIVTGLMYFELTQRSPN